jgi:hypothetical protein
VNDDPGDTRNAWELTPEEFELVTSKHRGTRLSFAILLIFFRERGRFPRDRSEVDRGLVQALREQLSVPTSLDWSVIPVERTAKRLRAEIRARYGFREATVADADALTEWLRDYAAPEAGGDVAGMTARLESRCRELSIVPPTAERIDRVVRTALHSHTERFHADVYGCLSPTVRERLDELLQPSVGEAEDAAAQGDQALRACRTSWRRWR